MNKNVNAMYFSATDTTRKVVLGLAENISKQMDRQITTTVNIIDFTLPEVRKKPVCLNFSSMKAICDTNTN